MVDGRRRMSTMRNDVVVMMMMMLVPVQGAFGRGGRRRERCSEK